MFRKKKETDEVLVGIQFNEHLTAYSCSKMVIEIIKYLAYQKQQIPYPFEQLKLLVNRKKESECKTGPKSRSLQLERHYSKAAEAVNILETIFEKIEAEFLTCQQEGLYGVEEVVLLFGATPVSPKDVFRIQLPLLNSHTNFETPKPPSRKLMLHLLRCLIESEELNVIINHPVATTNTFVFFKRKPSNDRVTLNLADNKSWFLPRENFKLPQKGRQAILRMECIAKEKPIVNFESPLAYPLNVSDIEDKNWSSYSPAQNEKLMKTEIEMAGSKVPPAFKLFSNHLVFKSHNQEMRDRTVNESMVDENKKLNDKVQCMVDEVLEGIESLNDSFHELKVDSLPVGNSQQGINYIEWFEARAPLRGFKDYVINGVSAINA